MGKSFVPRSALARTQSLRVVVLALSVAAVTLGTASLDAQQTTAEQTAPEQASSPDGGEAAAGGKMAFDVASVRQDKSEAKPQSNVKLNNSRTAYPPNGGVFTATNWPLVDFIAFAYKLTDRQVDVMAKDLPEWVFTDRFDIEAKSENHGPSKDQMRLMLQSVLEDRFKLVGRRESRDLPAFGLVPAKPGKTGPQLRQHSEDSPCPAQETVSPVRSAPVDAILKAWPPNCKHTTSTGDPGGVRLAGRNVTMGQIVDALTDFGEALGSRVVIDQTGLTGTFDFVVDFAEASETRASGDAGKIMASTPLPTLQDAIREQLGFKLIKQTAPFDCFVVVHVDHPSAN